MQDREESRLPEQTAESTADSKVALGTFFGIKVGMTRVFDSEGNHVPTTVVKLIPNVVVRVKTRQKDGYAAYQLGYGTKREKLVTKPVKGQLKRAKTDLNVVNFAEVRIEGIDETHVGGIVGYCLFAPDTYVDVSGTSKGKGFQGVIKRHGFAGGPGAHGSRFHRAPGSIGNNAKPAKVFKNKKMPGQMGNRKVTVKNIRVVGIDETGGYMLLKGAVPGAKNGFIKVVRSSRTQGAAER